MISAALLLLAEWQPTAMFHRPNTAVLALLLGVLLIYLEFNLPGRVLFGAAGTLLALLSVAGFLQMSLRPAAICLLACGVALLLLEAWQSLYAIAGVAGIITFIYGLLRLVTAPSTVHPAVAVIGGCIFSGATLVLTRIALRARRNKRTLTSSSATDGFLPPRRTEKPPFN